MEVPPVPGPKPGPSPGPSRAQARAQAGPRPDFWKFGNLRPGNLEIWDPRNQKNENSQNQNRFCPKCRQGFSMPEKGVPAPFGAIPGHFLRGPEKYKNDNVLLIFLGGPLLLSTLGGAIGIYMSTWNCAT